MAKITYNNPSEYQGKEWDELLRAMSPRDIKKTLKTSYRRIGKMIADIARNDLANSGLHNAVKMKRNIRVYAFSRGSGFMVTAKPHGKSGYYKRSQDGAEKPVAMWAAEGTKERHVNHGRHIYPVGNGQFRTMKGTWTGSMPGYYFLKRAGRMGESITDKNLQSEIKKAVFEHISKTSWH